MTGSQVRPRPEINVTPLVDVCLVLLIIFLVVSPVAQRGYNARLPLERGNPPPVPRAVSMVVRLGMGGELRLNGERVDKQELPARLSALLESRADRTVFFDAEDGVSYEEAAGIIDSLKHAGARIAVVTESRH